MNFKLPPIEVDVQRQIADFENKINELQESNTINGVPVGGGRPVVANSRILARKSTGSGEAEDCTLSEILDFISSAAQGDILYRGASAWARLAAGSAGQFLKTLGAGANPAWDTVNTGLTMLLLANAHGGTDKVQGNSSRFTYPGLNTLSNANLWISSESTMGFALPRAGTIDRLAVVTSSAEPNDGACVVMIRKNQADTALTLTIAANAAAGVFTDDTHSFSVNAGDLINFKATKSGATSSANFTCLSVRYSPTIP